MNQIATARSLVSCPPPSPSGSVGQHIAAYAANPLFGNIDSWVVENNPFRRPVRPQDVNQYSFTQPISGETLSSATGLAAQRMLLNVYENDMMFLPENGFAGAWNDYRLFYSHENRLAGEMIRPTLERHVFDFLESEIDVSGEWSEADMISLFDWRLDAVAKGESAVMKTVQASGNPREAATTFLIQLAGDFLTEASAMARNVLGNFGPAQSELFKVLIDEYGYGVHRTKHSTLFGETLRSCGLSAQVHAYWQFYLASSLALTNYFHFVSKNHENFFRYLGALYYTEASLVHVTRKQSQALRSVYGDRIDTKYFDEHTHIDQHHGSMVIDSIIKPIVEQCGTQVIPQIVRGFEEFRHLQDLADEDLIAQIAWSDGREAYKERAQPILARVKGGQIDCPIQTLEEPEGELSVTHVHDEDELLAVEDGELEIVTAFGQSVALGPGEGIIIPRHRLHGSLVLSESCTYQIITIGDYQSCLS